MKNVINTVNVITIGSSVTNNKQPPTNIGKLKKIKKCK